MQPLKQICSLNIAVCDPDLIQHRSVVEVTSYQIPTNTDARLNTVFDPRFGPFGYGQNCATCHCDYHECPGHFGHIQLVKPFFQPFFTNSVYTIVKNACWNCFQPLRCGCTTCGACGSVQGKWHRDGVFKDTFSHRVHDTKKVLTSTNVYTILQKHDAMNPEQRPSTWLLTTVLPVLPLASRPSVLHNGKWMHNSLSHTYTTIVKENEVLRAFVLQNQPQHVIHTQWRRMQDMVYNIYDVKPNDNSKAYREGFRQRIDGKQGRFRRHLLGKRVDFCARTVIGGDPTCKCVSAAMKRSGSAHRLFVCTCLQWPWIN